MISPSGSPVPASPELFEPEPLPPLASRAKYIKAIERPIAPRAINVKSLIAAQATPIATNAHTALRAIMLITIAAPTATPIPPPMVIPSDNH